MKRSTIAQVGFKKCNFFLGASSPTAESLGQIKNRRWSVLFNTGVNDQLLMND